MYLAFITWQQPQPPPPPINSRKQHRKRRCPLIRNDESLAVKSVSIMVIEHPSARLEQENGNLAQIEVDEMLGLVSYVAAKIPPDNAMPSGVELLVKLLEGKDKYLLLSQFTWKYAHRW